MTNNPSITSARESIARGDPEGALRVLASSPAIAESAEGRYLAAVAHFKNGDWHEAENQARLALGQNNLHAGASYYLGLALDRQRRTSEAIQAIQAALTIDPTMQKARQKLLSYGVTPSSAGLPGSTTPESKPASRSTTELTMPQTSEEWEAYRAGIGIKKRIDRKAENQAELSGLPWWAKILVAIIAIFILGGAASIISARSGDDEFDRQREQIQQQQCEIARQAGQTAPGC